ncbi:cyclomaltodextrinase [soil metagenome]
MRTNLSLLLFAPALVLIGAVNSAAAAASPAPGVYANGSDRAVAGVYDRRAADWRNGAVVYQVLVDRFAPSDHLDEKRALYPAPKVLRRWDQLPTRGTYLPEVKVWSHEIDFWGGDLRSVRGKLRYIDDLGADVLYLNPIHLAWTNHKYDALDYKALSPEFGTRADLDALIVDAHGHGLKVVLDGVFNHVGRNAPLFQAASAGPSAPNRDWFVWGPQYPGGARIWRDAQNLVELNLENPAVREYVWGAPDSVVQGYLAEGIDGWRLDVAYDIGFRYLAELTEAAHKRKPGSLVVGEIANYPREWFPSVDGVMDFTLRQVILGIALGQIDAPSGNRMIERIIGDAGIEPMLKSWMMLDNHDTERLATSVPDPARRRLAQVLQFTLPGSPNVYYGSEVGMSGGTDPAMRAPMRWDLVVPGNATLSWTRGLIALHQSHRALRVGDFRRVESSRLVAFERFTDRIEDAVVVLANPGSDVVTETVLVPDSKLMNDVSMIDLLDPAAAAVPIHSATLRITLQPGEVRVLAPDVVAKAGYSPYKRVQ